MYFAEDDRLLGVIAAADTVRPTSAEAVKKLREKGYITMDEQSSIELTESGLEIASKMLERHNTITGVLMQLGVSEDTACEDACRIEHDISDESYEAILKAFGGSVPHIHKHHSHIFEE